MEKRIPFYLKYTVNECCIFTIVNNSADNGLATYPKGGRFTDLILSRFIQACRQKAYTVSLCFARFGNL